MKLGPFDITEPLPTLHDPHVIASMRPWVDVGSVGTTTLTYLEGKFGAKSLAQLRRPGNFFDFTRYRPTAYFKEGRREVAVPNVTIHYATLPTGQDAIFMHLMEPHILGEAYVESILRLMERFGVRRYVLVGAMYDMVPHTKPLLVTGAASTPELQAEMDKLDVRSSTYEGPTTITGLMTQEANLKGIETTGMIVHLPQYAPLEEDHAGELKLLELLSELYKLPLDLRETVRQAERQYSEVTQAVAANPQLKRMVEQLESNYEQKRRDNLPPDEQPKLSSEIEKFLREMDT
ncbi:MAG: PAC2 family protein [Dehalococcoidia bacterium]|nr:PAC2 family protein [Dehalococcoidia bacterium]